MNTTLLKAKIAIKRSQIERRKNELDEIINELRSNNSCNVESLNSRYDVLTRDIERLERDIRISREQLSNMRKMRQLRITFIELETFKA